MKPELPNDKKLASVSRDARYTFVLLWTIADDDGLLRAEPRQLLGQVYPHDRDITEDLLEGWLNELVVLGVLRWHRTRDGARVGEIVNWSKHQIVKNRGKPFLLNELLPATETLTPSSVESTETLGVRSQESGVRSLESLPSPNGDDVLVVFNHWKSESGHDKAKLTANRRRKIGVRLKSFSAEQLCAALTAGCRDPFYRGENDRNTRYDWVETLLKSDEAVERHLAKAKQAHEEIEVYTPDGQSFTPEFLRAIRP